MVLFEEGYEKKEEKKKKKKQVHWKVRQKDGGNKGTTEGRKAKEEMDKKEEPLKLSS